MLRQGGLFVAAAFQFLWSTLVGSVRNTTPVVLVGLCCLLPSSAHADLIINTPAGLAAGDQFRIIFITDGVHNATSADISTYNSFVNSDAQAQAGGGNVTYHGTILSFSAIASTSSISAINNVGTSGAPVYLAGGTLVATTDGTSTAGLFGTFFGSAPFAHAINQDLLGNVINHLVWTGSLSNGQAGTGGGTDPLGGAASSSPGFGVSSEDTYQAIGAGGGAGYPSNSLYFYGISQTLTVPSEGPAAPEPPSFILATMALSAFVASRLGKMWRKPIG